jgi:uncharacterized membrane protein YoaK (UPF0700 family)
MNQPAASVPRSTFDLDVLREGARSIRHPLTRALLALTFTTGLVDAVSYLGLGRVFTANMTGNVVLLGFGIAGSGGLPVVAPIVSLIAFLAGAVAGGILAKRLLERHPEHLGAALGVEVALVALAALLAAVINVQPGSFSGDLLIAALAFAMGVRNATTRKIGVTDVTTTVLTGTLTALAADSPLTGGTGRGLTRRLSTVVAMLTGAIAGALLLKTSLVLPLVCAAALALVTWVVYIPAARREIRAARRRANTGAESG